MGFKSLINIKPEVCVMISSKNDVKNEILSDGALHLSWFFFMIILYGELRNLG